MPTQAAKGEKRVEEKANMVRNWIEMDETCPHQVNDFAEYAIWKTMPMGNDVNDVNYYFSFETSSQMGTHILVLRLHTCRRFVIEYC